MHHLLLFAKCPAPGSCKTRLIPRLGAQGASQFAQAALVDLLHLLSEAPIQRVWLYTPSTAHQTALGTVITEHLQAKWQVHPQSDGAGHDLGHRLSAAFAWAKGNIPPDQMDSSSVTFIGMDCFDLTAERVRNAAEGAARGVAQVLPAQDGGYVLLSVPANCPPDIFNGIPWSCDKTCDAQIASIRGNGVDVVVGQTLADVDEPSDLDELIKGKHKLQDFPRTLQVLEALIQDS